MRNSANRQSPPSPVHHREYATSGKRSSDSDPESSYLWSLQAGPPKARAKAGLRAAEAATRRLISNDTTALSGSGTLLPARHSTRDAVDRGSLPDRRVEASIVKMEDPKEDSVRAGRDPSASQGATGGAYRERCQYGSPPSSCHFRSLISFAEHLQRMREGLEDGKARYAGLTTQDEYEALLRVRKDQDIHTLRKKGKRPATADAAVVNEQSGDPQRRYMLRTGGWELTICDKTGETVLARPSRSTSSEGKGSSSATSEVNRSDGDSTHGQLQVWVHEGNVEWHLWRIHSEEMEHAGMDKTWSEVQRQLYGCTQNLCRTYVVACGCADSRGKKRARGSQLQPGHGMLPASSPARAVAAQPVVSAGDHQAVWSDAVQSVQPTAAATMRHEQQRLPAQKASDRIQGAAGRHPRQLVALPGQRPARQHDLMEGSTQSRFCKAEKKAEE